MYTVLCVDDEELFLEVSKIYLEHDGCFAVQTTTSVDRALGLLATGTIDAIVSDYRMPGTDGLAFLRRVRSRFGAIPFILFTSEERDEVMIPGLLDGMDFCVLKGGSPDAQFAELAHVLKMAIRSRAAERILRERGENLPGSCEPDPGVFRRLILSPGARARPGPA